MISLVFTSSQIHVSMYNKNDGKFLFNAPLKLAENGYQGAAALVKQELKKRKISTKRVAITLMEDVIFKEFSHQPVAQKAVGGFAKLEARTVLREQYSSFSVSYLPYGEYLNSAGEHVCLLLATPIAILNSIVTGFASEGFIVTAIHSGFDAYAAVTNAVWPHIMGKQTYAAIDFGYEYTIINIYANGVLASQRRLPGLNASLMPVITHELNISEDAAKQMIIDGNYPTEFEEQVANLETSFVWDILRTVRVVCAPIHLDPESFCISGEACKNDKFRAMLVENLGLPCKFIDDAEIGKALPFKGPYTSSVISIGGSMSKLNLLGEVRGKKKDSDVNLLVCAALTLIMVLGLCAQPFAVFIKTQTLQAAKTRLNALMPVSTALDEVSLAQMRISAIDASLAQLKTYTSNTSATLPDVLALFTQGLVLKSVDYSGEDGSYNVSFTTADKNEFLRLKEKIYQNESYYLNLSLSSTLDENGKYECNLSFTPLSYVALPVLENDEVTGEEPVKNSPDDMLEGVEGGNIK